MALNASPNSAPHLAIDGTASAIAKARRATAAVRYAVDSFDVEWRDLGDLEDIVDEWRDLAARALAPNVFYEPGFARAAAEVFGHGVGAVLVWSETSPRKLAGFFPGRIETRRYGLKLPVLVGWTHPFAPLGVPLVDQEAAEPVIAAWLAHIAADPKLPGLLLLRFLPEDGAFAAALVTILRRARMPAADFNRHRRALLAPASGERSRYAERALSPRKLKELRRIGRRLSDLGAMLFTAATEFTAVTGALDDFFALEASGWKGRAGTAAAHHGEVRRFMQRALQALAAEGKVIINRILIDGAAIAATITLRSGDHAWFWKIAHDEYFARYSPGVMLTIAVTEDLADDTGLARTDSCATADHPMIDHIWRQRLPLCDLLIGVGPQAPFGLARRLESLRTRLIAAAKRLRKKRRG